MAHHPNEPLVENVGIAANNRGRSCEHHNVCGDALTIDCVVRFRSIQILNGKNVEGYMMVIACNLRLTLLF
jgi:hypothetical protein